jgi:hypothetical protein
VRAWCQKVLRLVCVRLPWLGDPGPIVIASVCVVVAATAAIALGQEWPEFLLEVSDSTFRGHSDAWMLAVTPMGTEAPAFTLTDAMDAQQVRLTSYRGHQPVVLIFGSFT